MKWKGKCSLILFISLFCKVLSEVELIKVNSQMHVLQHCALSDDKDTEEIHTSFNNSVSNGHDQSYYNPLTNRNYCNGRKSDKIFETRLTDDGYLKGGGVFYPPKHFCVNFEEDTSRICPPQKLVINKCCREDEIWDLDKHQCRKAPHRFRPKLTDTISPLFQPNSDEDTNLRIPFRILSDQSSEIRNPSTETTNPKSMSSTVKSPLICPSGLELRIYISDQCSSMTSSSFLEKLTGMNANASIFECLLEMPYEKCRFKITQTGIEYETASGLFHRKSEMNRLQHEHYCVEGYFSNPLCYYINRTTDNEVIQRRCVQSLNQFLMFCEPSGALAQSEQNPSKAYCLATIWLSTCPLLFSAAFAKCVTSRKNVHGWTLSCYLISMFFVNINSAILALESKSLGCKVTDFSMKFLYLSTLCWLTSINFGLWRAFRSNLPNAVPKSHFIYNLLFSTVLPGVVVTISYFAAQVHTCGSQYCALYSHKTIPYYNLPVIFLISLNLGLFIRTSMIIAGLRRETSSVLQKEPSGRRNLETFRLFSKLFLMTGPIWVIRLVLFFLQIKGVYFTWYGVLFEGIFSIPEAIFSIMVLLHPEFKKFFWQKYPNTAQKLAAIIPCFNYSQGVNIELGSKSLHSTNTVNGSKSPTPSLGKGNYGVNI